MADRIVCSNGHEIIETELIAVRRRDGSTTIHCSLCAPPSSRKGPSWDTPARLDGLPAKNWRSREGVTMNGSLAACVRRWLELPRIRQEDCSLGWGPTAGGRHGSWEQPAILGYIVRNGPPPGMAPGVTVEQILASMAMQKVRPVDPTKLDDDPPGHHAGGDGGASAMEAWRERRRRKL